MIRQLFGGSVLALAACATGGSVVQPVTPLAASQAITLETIMAMNAMCGAEARFGSEGEADVQLIEGMGSGGFAVGSDVPEAQAWFDYSLALYHAYYHRDTIAAMRKAVEADPECARCAWGLALVLGPTLNTRPDEEEIAEALAEAERAKTLLGADDKMGAELIDAIIARYQPSEEGTEPAFGRRMLEIAQRYPDEPEVAVLAAHSLMIPVRFDDESGLDTALETLEGVLRRRPNDTGAIHYYIHGTEFAGRPGDALGYARRLGELAPAASHLVHMPAHTYFRVGQYHHAGEANANAIDADMQWVTRGGDNAEAWPLYYAHNLAFGLAGALMSGDAQLAVKYADHATMKWPAGAPMRLRSYPVARTYVALGRHAPDRALAIPESDEFDARMTVYRHYARGEALITKGDLRGAMAEARAIGRVKSADGGVERVLAKAVIEGRVAMARGQYGKAARIFARAADVQDADLAESWDPPGWWYPVRRSLAAARLQAGDFAAAEAEARAVLEGWTDDPLSLWVIGEALKAQGKTNEGEAALSKARGLWFGDFDSVTAEAI